MFVLLVIIIGLALFIVFNFHRFKSSFLSLFIWSYFTKNDRKGRNWHNQQRKKKNNDSRSRSRSTNQHNSHKLSTNKSIKNDKKEWPTLAEASKLKRKKKQPFFGKARPYKQRQEQRFETVEIKKYEESETDNNDQQNKYTTIVPDTQDVPNQIEENGSNSLRDNFFSMAKKQRKPTKERTDY